MYTTQELETYIRWKAQQEGVDPDTAVKVARSEGLGAQSYLGDAGRSGGPFQLYTGGGLGNEFTAKTGLNPLDPKNALKTIDFALENVKRTGWTPYHGARRVGITDPWQGINRDNNGVRIQPAGGGPDNSTVSDMPANRRTWGQSTNVTPSASNDPFPYTEPVPKEQSKFSNFMSSLGTGLLAGGLAMQGKDPSDVLKAAGRGSGSGDGSTSSLSAEQRAKWTEVSYRLARKLWPTNQTEAMNMWGNADYAKSYTEQGTMPEQFKQQAIAPGGSEYTTKKLDESIHNEQQVFDVTHSADTVKEDNWTAYNKQYAIDNNLTKVGTQAFQQHMSGISDLTVPESKFLATSRTQDDYNKNLAKIQELRTAQEQAGTAASAEQRAVTADQRAVQAKADAADQTSINVISRLGTAEKLINEGINDKSWTGTGVGTTYLWGQLMPQSRANEIKAEYDALEAIGSGQQLSNMRSESKTGGGPGSITEREWPILSTMFYGVKFNPYGKADVEMRKVTTLKNLWIAQRTDAGGGKSILEQAIDNLTADPSPENQQEFDQMFGDGAAAIYTAKRAGGQ